MATPKAIIQENVDLKPFNTMGVAVTARYFAEVNHVSELKSVLNFQRDNQLDLVILGGGSNVLFTENVDGLVLLNRIRGIEIVREDDTSVFLKIGAGENWHETVNFCVENKWAGIENLSLIPGTVGAAPIQNIGAYGVELEEVFVELEAWMLSSDTLQTISKATCNFGYRESIFKNEWKGKCIICSVTLELKKSFTPNISYGALKQHLQEEGIQHPTLQEVSNAVIDVRQSKLPDPNEIGNNGSFFKNPVIDVFHYDELKKSYHDLPGYPVTEHLVKIPAGWLIDRAGWKGFRKGDAGVHKKQALVLVNYGKASGAEIVSLSTLIQNDIVKKYGIKLHREVNIR